MYLHLEKYEEYQKHHHQQSQQPYRHLTAYPAVDEACHLYLAFLLWSIHIVLFFPVNHSAVGLMGCKYQHLCYLHVGWGRSSIVYHICYVVTV